MSQIINFPVSYINDQADIFLGVSFDIASYALFTIILAQVCGYAFGEFVHTVGDAHIYSNHMEQVQLQLKREPKKLPHIKGEVAV